MSRNKRETKKWEGLPLFFLKSCTQWCTRLPSGFQLLSLRDEEECRNKQPSPWDRTIAIMSTQQQYLQHSIMDKGSAHETSPFPKMLLTVNGCNYGETWHFLQWHNHGATSLEKKEFISKRKEIIEDNGGKYSHSTCIHVEPVKI